MREKKKKIQIIYYTKNISEKDTLGTEGGKKDFGLVHQNSSFNLNGTVF